MKREIRVSAYVLILLIHILLCMCIFDVDYTCDTHTYTHHSDLIVPAWTNLLQLSNSSNVVHNTDNSAGNMEWNIHLHTYSTIQVSEHILYTVLCNKCLVCYSVSTAHTDLDEDHRVEVEDRVIDVAHLHISIIIHSNDLPHITDTLGI